MQTLITLGAQSTQQIVLIGGLVVAIIVIVLNAIRSMVRERQREQTCRELAAYVAEGSISPVDAERLIRAGRPGESRTEESIKKS